MQGGTPLTFHVPFRPYEASALAKEMVVEAVCILEHTVVWTKEGSGRTEVHLPCAQEAFSCHIALFHSQPLTLRDFSVSLLEGDGGGGRGLLLEHYPAISRFPYTSKPHLCPHGSLWAFYSHPDTTFRNKIQNPRWVQMKWFFSTYTLCCRPV